MDIPIEVPDSSIAFIIEREITKAVKDRVDLVCNEDIAGAIVSLVKKSLSGKNPIMQDSGAIAKVLDKRLGEMLTAIDDDSLKNILLQRLISKCNK